MAKPIQVEAEMRVPHREMTFKSAREEETSISATDPDTLLIAIVLLFACIALALLADVII
jgi:hypothetical protein